MKESPPGYDAHVEDANVKIKRLGEGVSTGWEGEPLFTTEEVTAAVKELDPKAGDLRVTDKLLSYEGVLLSASLRASGSTIGYSFMLKGSHGGSGRPRTVIDRMEFADSNSELVTFAQEIAEYRDGAWIK